jgi:hypothetical protein
MSYGIGLDGRQLLPPFMPWQRNGDGVFGVTLRACSRDALVGFVPWAVVHEARGRTASLEGLLRSATAPLSNDVLCLLIASSSLRSEVLSSARAMRALGEVLSGLGAQPPEEFAAIVRRHVVHARARELAAVNDALALHDCEPTHWAQDLRRWIMALEQSVAHPSVGTPRDLAADTNRQDPMSRLALQIGHYGQLLKHWPELSAASVELRQAGRSLATRL